MKTIINYFLALVCISLFSCEGSQGPPGLDGGIIVSDAFEIVVDFNAANNYERIEPYGFDVYPFDVTLVYILWDTDIWRLLPQRTEFADGFLQYNYDFTQSDVRLFLDGTTDFNALGTDWTNGQVFRVVVIPAENIDGIDVSNINEVMAAGNFTDFKRL